MKLGLDLHAHLESPIHRWEPRAKLIGLLGLVFAFSVIQDLRLLPLIILVTAVLFRMSRLPLSYLLERLKLPGYFLLALALMLPFVSGQTVVWELGPLAMKAEGLESLIIIATRFVCIITVTLVLFGTAPFLTSIKALRALGLPPLLADMILLTYRYLFEISDHLNTMRTAIRMRGFQGSNLSRRNLNTLAALVGSLLVRSYEQSEQIYHAMILRGYGQSQVIPDEFHTQRRDFLLTILVLGVAATFVIAQYWLTLLPLG